MISTKGLIFDYGGTIDTNGIHWGEVIWSQYELSDIGIKKELFREAYVYGERTLAKKRIITPQHTFYDLLKTKISLQFDYLKSVKALHNEIHNKQENIVKGCYSTVTRTIKKTSSVIEHLSQKFPSVLVTNFYGNMPVVLKEFSLDNYFNAIIESSAVGIRKPNPELFALGIKALNIDAKDVTVIGDSYRKDIIPALSLGCKAIWLKKTCWEEEPIISELTPTAIINNLEQLKEFLKF